MELSKVAALGWDDIELERISWESGGRDIVFYLIVPWEDPAFGGSRVLICRWARALLVKMAFPDGEGGAPLTWDVTIVEISDRNYSILLDFGSRGEVRLMCSEIEVIVRGAQSRHEVSHL